MNIQRLSILILTATFGLGCCELGLGAIVPAGTLYVDLDPTTATSFGDGNAVTTWTNTGTLGDFVTEDSPLVYTANVASTGAAGVTSTGNQWLLGPTAVADIAGNSNRSIEVWAYNPAYDPLGPDTNVGEIMVSYGPHAVNQDVWFGQGSSSTQGAVVHFGDDYSWATPPTVGQWNHLVYTYDGAGVEKLYVNGILDTTRGTLSGILATGLNDIMLNVVQGIGNAGTMSYGAVRIWGGELSQEDVVSNHDEDAAKFGRALINPVPEPSSYTLAAFGLLGLLAYQRRTRRGH